MEVAQAATLAQSSITPTGNDAAFEGDKNIESGKSIPMTVQAPPVGPNEALAAELKGRVMHVPNMMLFMNGWPHRERNRHCGQMRNIVNEALDR